MFGSALLGLAACSLPAESVINGSGKPAFSSAAVIRECVTLMDATGCSDEYAYNQAVVSYDHSLVVRQSRPGICHCCHQQATVT